MGSGGTEYEWQWQIWVQYSGGEMVSIQTVGEGAVDFSNVKSIALSTLELVD